MEEKKKLSSIQKVWLSGTTLVIAIPRRIREIVEIHKGDYLQVDWGEVIKKAKVADEYEEEEEDKEIEKRLKKEKKKDLKVLDEEEPLPEM